VWTPVRVDSWLGIHNTSPIRSIPNSALSAATDVDIDDAGIITRRNGYARAKALSNVTSAYSTLDQAGYVAAAGTLYRVLPDLSTLPLAASTATEFTDFAKVLFTNDGLKVEDNVVTSIKLPSPQLPPDLTRVSGALPAGSYSACYTYRSATGLESGSSPIATIELTEDGGISVAPITPPSGYTVNVYTTDANGAVYYDPNGIPLNQSQILSQPFPDDAEKIAYHESRLWVSQSLQNGSTIIWFSDPFHYHIFDAINGYIIVPGLVHAMVSSAQGLVIGTDSAIYVYDEALTKVANYGTVAGRPFTRLPDGTVLMHTQRGVCRGLPFENLTERKASFAPGVQCSTALVQQDGINKFVVVTDGGGIPYNART